MLLKVTNRCGAGCSHCMEDSTPAGAHMSLDTFEAALDFTARTEGIAWRTGIPPRILLSGGECTEHPEIVAFVERVRARGFLPMLLSNGHFLADNALRDALLRPEWPEILVQVTYDPRFYPKRPTQRVNDPRIVYVDALTVLLPLGRQARKTGRPPLPFRKGPSSFNLRSLAQQTRSFSLAVCALRLRAATGSGGSCTPSVSQDGSVVAGESNLCFRLGTVWDSEETLTAAILTMGSCNRCGLETNLSPEQRRALDNPKHAAMIGA